MKIKELFDKKIPMRNYVIVIVVSVLVIFISLLASSLYLSNREELHGSIFEEENSNISQININDIDFVKPEISDAVLYVSYYSNEFKSMERKLYREIKKNELNDKFIYLNISNEKNYIEKLKEKFPNISFEISDAPMMIYIKDGEAVEAVNSEFKMVDYTVFNKLIKKYYISNVEQ